MHVDADEEERGTVSVKVPDESSVVDVPADMSD